MEPWRPAKDKWCRIVFNDGPGQRYHGDGLAGLILGASKQSDSFLNGEGRRCFLAHITPGEVWKVLTTDGQVHHWHQHHLRPLKKKCTDP